MRKSYVIPAAFKKAKVPGQVPHAEGRAIMQSVTQRPPARKASMLLDHDGPRLSINHVVGNLGMDPAVESGWRQYLTGVLKKGYNELVVRQQLMQKLVDDKVEPELRKALFQRSMSYYRGLKKSMVDVSPLSELKKAEARGGSYHRRTPKTGGGYRYYYDEEKYNTSTDAHLSGKDARKSCIKKGIGGAIDGSEGKGCDLREFKSLAQKHGSSEVANMIRGGVKSGDYKYAKGKLSHGKSQKNGTLKKSYDHKFIIRS